LRPGSAARRPLRNIVAENRTLFDPHQSWVDYTTNIL
jgi:hypothetical protein